MKTEPITNAVIENILSRKSTRAYKPGIISREVLETLMKAAMGAPSARNVQPWSFICVTHKKTLNLLAEGLPYAKMLNEAAAAIIVCGMPDNSEERLSDYWVQDCSAATQNILLAAESLGLGSVWTGVYPREERVIHVKKVLDIPRTIIPLNVIPLGYPAGQESPKDKHIPAKIHWESW